MPTNEELKQRAIKARADIANTNEALVEAQRAEVVDGAQARLLAEVETLEAQAEELKTTADEKGVEVVPAEERAEAKAKAEADARAEAASALSDEDPQAAAKAKAEAEAEAKAKAEAEAKAKVEQAAADKAAKAAKNESKTPSDPATTPTDPATGDN